MAAELHDLNILCENIEDYPNNETRFLVISQTPAKPTGNDKTAALISIKDRPGALYQLLLPFSESGVNLTRIESRPSRKKAWEYVFFVDMVGHIDDPKVKQALDRVAEQCNELRILGSFPQGDVEE